MKAADRSRPKASALVAPDARPRAMVEVNCETDFVSRNDDFKRRLQPVRAAGRARQPGDVAASALPPRRPAPGVARGARAEDRREHVDPALRCDGRQSALASYLHGVKIGVLVDVTGGRGHQLDAIMAMHIAATTAGVGKSPGVSADRGRGR